jgi:predicted transcriptional regulator
MPQPLQNGLSRRERQIMDVLYRLGEVGAAEVVQHLSDRPAYNSVRVTLGILERKGFVRHRRDGARYVYAPTVPAEKARESALRHLVRTFFRGSPSKAILTLLDSPSTRLSPEELNELAAWVEAAKREKGP